MSQCAVQKDGTLVEEYRYNDPVHPGLRTYEMNTLRGIVPGRSLSYNTEDQLQSNVASTFHYDPDGNVDQVSGSWGTAALTYSARGELLSVTMPGGTTVISYVYDPLGRRIAKKVNGATVEKYLWSGLTTLLAVYDGIDNLVMRFEYADGRMPVSMTRGGATYYLSYDQVGTLRAVYDATGAIVKRIDYDTFGNVLDDSNPGFAMPFGFAGGLRDSDTDLVHFGYRDYSPETGRWFQKDPIGFAGGDVNVYGYCLDDPVNFVDPTGENPWLMRFAIGALAGIAEEMLFEMWDNFQNGRPWDCFDWVQIGLAGLFGGLTSAGLGGLGAKIGGKLKGLLEQWGKGGKSVQAVLNYDMEKLQHMFNKHANDFGITGNWNKSMVKEFDGILRSHVQKIAPIKGTYRGTQQVLHYFDPKTGLNVMTDMDGNLIGGWKLSADQIKYLKSLGNIQ